MGQREINELRAEIRALRSGLRMRPITTVRGGAAPDIYILRMGGGNSIATYGATTYYGLKYPTSEITSVPTSAPSEVDGATPNQIGPAYLVGPDGQATTLVWVGTKLKPTPTSAVATGMLSIISKGTTFMSSRIVSMQIGTSGVFVPVYIPERVT